MMESARRKICITAIEISRSIFNNDEREYN